MARLANITAAAWATSGTANAAGTGLNTLTGSPTYTAWSAADPAPSFAGSAVSYLRGADSAAITMRIDAASVPLQGASTDYWIRFGARVRAGSSFVLGTTPADSAFFYLHSIVSTSTRERIEMRARHGSTSGFTGFGFNAPLFTGTGTVRHLPGSGAANTLATMYPGEWYQLIIHLSRTASGLYEIFCNGARVLVHDGVDYATLVALVDAGTQWTITLGGIAGIACDFCGPFESWDSTDITIAQNIGELKSTDYCWRRFPMDWVDGRKGDFWTKTGTGTYDITDYTASGANPLRRRMRTTGSTSTQTVILTSVEQVGTVSYNVDGDTAFVFPMLYWPGGATGSVELRTTGGATLIKLDFDGTNLKQGSTTLFAWTAAERYALVICLRNTGAATCWATSLTKNHAVALSPNVYPADLATWTPQAIGNVVITTTVGSTVCEVDGCWAMTIHTVGATDSVSHIDVNLLTPIMAMNNHVAREWPRQIGSQYPINASWPFRHLGLPHLPCMIIVGRAGTTRTAFDTYLRPYFSKSPGAMVLVVDGGSINDTTTVVDAATRDSEAASLLTEVQNEIDNFPGWRVYFGLVTMMRREQSTTTPTYGGPGSLKNQAIDLFNSGLRTKVRANRTNRFLIFMDPARYIDNHLSVFASGDDTHPTTAGSVTIVSKMAQYFGFIPMGGGGRKRRRG